MKALTIYQPWASLTSISAKRYETRSWATKYRGPIAIHAGVKNAHSSMIELPPYIQSAMFSKLYDAFPIKAGALKRLPHGAVIATAELVGCWEIGRSEVMGACVYKSDCAMGIIGNEILFGNWTPGRYAWELDNIKLLDEPIATKGKQGLWNWEASQ